MVFYLPLPILRRIAWAASEYEYQTLQARVTRPWALIGVLKGIHFLACMLKSFESISSRLGRQEDLCQPLLQQKRIAAQSKPSHGDYRVRC